MNAESDARPAVDVEPDLQLLAALRDTIHAVLDAAQGALGRAALTGAAPAPRAALDDALLAGARQVDELVGVFDLHGLDAPARLAQALAALLQATRRADGGPLLDAAVDAGAAVRALKADVQQLLDTGQRASPAALYAPYRRLRLRLGADPALDLDFWHRDWCWVDLSVPDRAGAGGDAAALQHRLEAAALDLIRSTGLASAPALADLAVQLAQRHSGRRARVFWLLAAAYFEGVAQGWVAADAACRRTTLAILAQQRARRPSKPQVDDHLVVELLGVCRQGLGHPAPEGSATAQVRRAFALMADAGTACDAVDAVDGALARYLNDAEHCLQGLSDRLAGPSPPDAVRLDQAAALAATLADASRAVAFIALAELAQALSQALQSLSPAGFMAHERLIADVLDETRGLLHQFAAGFVRQPDPAHLQALQQLLPAAPRDAAPGPA